MNPADDFEDLFARYWDNALSPAELAALEDRLRTDPAARDRFRLCMILAVTAGEHTDATPLPAAWGEAVRPTRRRALRYAMAGAVGLAGVASGLLLWRRPAGPDPLRLVAATGSVTVGGRKAELGAGVPAGATVATAGTDASVTLAVADDCTILLPGDSSVVLGDDGRLLTLTRGHLAADISAVTSADQAITVATAGATFRVAPAVAAVALVVGHQGQRTDLSVEKGRVLISHPVSGEPLAEAGAGDYVAVHAATGRVTKESRRVVPDAFQLDLRGPLPRAWEAGNRGDDGLLTPEWWFDKYHRADMFQVRSHNAWTRGFARLYPDSRVRMKYRVARPGRGQVCLCVRTLYATEARHVTGMLDSVTAFEDATPGAWQWFDRRADQMLDSKEKPTFPAPWVAFVLIVNTYEDDLGLEIAAFEIIRPPTGGRV